MEMSKRYQNYIEGLYREDDSIKRRCFIDKTGWKDFVPVVDDDVARFLRLMLQIKKPMKILEIGTSIGFSTTSMALIAKDYGGTITTIEYDKIAYEQANTNFMKSGVDHVVDIIYGDAREIIPSFADNSFDFIFQDVDKRLYPELLQECIRVLKAGGIFIADDTLFPVMTLDNKWKNQIEPINTFNHLVAGTVQLDSTLLPIGDGIMVSVKK